MGHKAFRRAANLDPVWFTLPGKGDEEIRFDCQPDLAAGVILAFANATEGGDVQQQGVNAIKAVHDLFDAAVVEEQHDQFWAMVNDRKGGIGVSLLIEVAQWLSEEYSERPTGQSSAPGRPATQSGNGSTDGASREVTTYSRTEPAAVST